MQHPKLEYSGCHPPVLVLILALPPAAVLTFAARSPSALVLLLVLQAEHPKVRVADMAVDAGRAWRDLPAEQRARFEAQSAASKVTLLACLPGWPYLRPRYRGCLCGPAADRLLVSKRGTPF